MGVRLQMSEEPLCVLLSTRQDPSCNLEALAAIQGHLAHKKLPPPPPGPPQVPRHGSTVGSWEGFLGGALFLISEVPLHPDARHFQVLAVLASLSRSHKPSFVHTLSLSHPRSLTHPVFLPPSLSRAHPRSRTRSLSHPLSRTHPRSRTHPVSLTRFVSRTHLVSRSLPLSHNPSFANSIALAHTLSRVCRLAHTLVSLTHPCSRIHPLSCTRPFS